MTLPSPETVLPHRGDMVLLEEIVDWGEDWIEARAHRGRLRAFRSPDGALSAVAAMELICQTAASHAGLTSLAKPQPVRIGFIIGARSLEFDTLAFGKTESFHVSVKQEFLVDDETCVYRGKVFGKNPSGPLIASGTITAVMPEDSFSVLNPSRT